MAEDRGEGSDRDQVRESKGALPPAPRPTPRRPSSPTLKIERSGWTSREQSQGSLGTSSTRTQIPGRSRLRSSTCSSTRPTRSGRRNWRSFAEPLLLVVRRPHSPSVPEASSASGTAGQSGAAVGAQEGATSITGHPAPTCTGSDGPGYQDRNCAAESSGNLGSSRRQGVFGSKAEELQH